MLKIHRKIEILNDNEVGVSLILKNCLTSTEYEICTLAKQAVVVNKNNFNSKKELLTLAEPILDEWVKEKLVELNSATKNLLTVINNKKLSNVSK